MIKLISNFLSTTPDTQLQGGSSLGAAAGPSLGSLDPSTMLRASRPPPALQAPARLRLRSGQKAAAKPGAPTARGGPARGTSGINGLNGRSTGAGRAVPDSLPTYQLEAAAQQAQEARHEAQRRAAELQAQVGGRGLGEKGVVRAWRAPQSQPAGHVHVAPGHGRLASGSAGAGPDCHQGREGSTG